MKNEIDRLIALRDSLSRLIEALSDLGAVWRLDIEVPKQVERVEDMPSTKIKRTRKQKTKLTSTRAKYGPKPWELPDNLHAWAMSARKRLAAARATGNREALMDVYREALDATKDGDAWKATRAATALGADRNAVYAAMQKLKAKMRGED